MLTSTDGLTGLSNRRSFDKALTGELARCARDHPPLVLLLVDVDHSTATTTAMATRSAMIASSG
jgi:PleD family two-component response regulator